MHDCSCICQTAGNHEAQLSTAKRYITDLDSQGVFANYQGNRSWIDARAAIHTATHMSPVTLPPGHIAVADALPHTSDLGEIKENSSELMNNRHLTSLSPPFPSFSEPISATAIIVNATKTPSALHPPIPAAPAAKKRRLQSLKAEATIFQIQIAACPIGDPQLPM